MVSLLQMGLHSYTRCRHNCPNRVLMTEKLFSADHSLMFAPLARTARSDTFGPAMHANQSFATGSMSSICLQLTLLLYMVAMHTHH